MTRENKHFIGIDLGTTNSVVCFGRIDKNNKIKANVVKIKAFDEENNYRITESLPSYVYFKDNESPLIGGAAKGMIATQPSKVIKSIKSKMGEEYSLKLNNEIYKPEDISGLILSFIAKKTEEFLKTFPKDVIITVPASFNSDQRSATIKAAEKAGFNIYDENGKLKNILLDEPRAALFDFIESYNRGEYSETTIDLYSPKNILVFDLGGGTLDVSLHKVSYSDNENKINIDDYAISRYTQIGGDNFDSILAKSLLGDLEKKGLNINKLSNVEKNEIQMKLLKVAEEAKLDLSNEINQILEFSYDDINEEELNEVKISIIKSNIWDNRGLDTELSLEEYKKLISDFLGEGLKYEDYKKINDIDFCTNDNIIFPILDVLSKAEKKIGKKVKVDAVLLNGGMTKFYPIKERIEKFFGFPPLALGDEDKSVAKGAVYYHYSLHRGVVYNKIQNESIGIATEGDYVKHLIPAGSVLPYKISILDKFEIKEDGATSILLPFYLGERNDTKTPNRKIANRRIKFNSPLSKGTPIKLEVEVDESGIMNVKGWLENNSNDYFEVTLETEKIENSDEKLVEYKKKYQKVKIKEKQVISKFGADIDIDEMIMKFDKLFFDKNFSNSEYKNMVNKIKIAKNGIKISDYLLKKYKTVSKENKTRIISILSELGKEDITLGRKVTNLCINSSTEEAILELNDTKDINRIIKECVNAIGKIGDFFSESHLLYILNLPYTLNIVEDIIIAIGKVGYSKNALKHLEKLLEQTTTEDIGKRIRLIWSIAKIGSREKISPIESNALVKVIFLIKEILKNTKHKELLDKGIYALGELCDSRFGNEVNEDIANETIEFLKSIYEKKGNKTQKICLLMINMIKGNVLTQEEEESLLSIRSHI